MIRALVLFTALLSSTPAFAQLELKQHAYWNLMAGWWRAENTYMNGELDYNIRSYNALIHVELNGKNYTETEYKFYAPSKLALTYGKGQTTADEGIETVSVLKGELVDATGTVKLTGTVPPGPAPEEVTVMKILSPDTGVRVTPNTITGSDTYRMFVFAPTADKRYRSNFGLVSDKTGSGAANATPAAKLGDLRGFSLFREDRIAPAEFEKWRAEFRARNKVAAIVEAGADGKPTVRRLK